MTKIKVILPFSYSSMKKIRKILLISDIDFENQNCARFDLRFQTKYSCPPNR